MSTLLRYPTKPTKDPDAMTPTRKHSDGKNAQAVDLDERVSLHPLEFEDALRALLTATPDDEKEGTDGNDS